MSSTMLAFLCGGMEYVQDGGRGWREHLRLWINQELGHRVFDPIIEAQRILSEEELANFLKWKCADFERFRKTMRFIINHDLEVMAREADYVVCHWDVGTARGGGTHAELTAALRKGIPVYFVTEMAPNDISGWVLGCADKIFTTFSSLKEFLTENYGKQRGQTTLFSVPSSSG